MFKLADLVEANQETLATLETWNGGKPYGVALGEDVAETISTLRYYAGWADKIHGETIPTTPQKFAYTIKQPIGVCGQIIPWNYPIMMAAWLVKSLLQRKKHKLIQLLGSSVRHWRVATQWF